jgi:hypothetical protein
MTTPPDFVAGQILTAAQMSAVGTWLVKTQVVGSGVSSVAVTGAFSADYDNYLITYSNGSASADTHISMILGATTSGYYSAISGNTWSNSASNSGGTGQSSFTYAFSGFATYGVNGAVLVQSPFLAKYSLMSSQFVASFGSYASSGMLQNTTSYTGFTLTPGSGTLTGGTIRVYGYRL